MRFMDSGLVVIERSYGFWVFVGNAIGVHCQVWVRGHLWLLVFRIQDLKGLGFRGLTWYVFVFEKSGSRVIEIFSCGVWRPQDPSEEEQSEGFS